MQRLNSILPIEAGQVKAAIFGDLHVVLSAGMNPDGPTKLNVQAYRCKAGSLQDAGFNPPAVLIHGGKDLFRGKTISRWDPLQGSSHTYYQADTWLDATRSHLITIRAQGGEEAQFELQAVL